MFQEAKARNCDAITRALNFGDSDDNRCSPAVCFSIIISAYGFYTFNMCCDHGDIRDVYLFIKVHITEGNKKTACTICTGCFWS